MWEFYLPTRIIFGRESLNRLGVEVKSLGEPVLLVTGKRAIRESGILDRVNRILNQEKIACVVFDQVSPEPDTEVVDRGVTFAGDNRCKVVIGIGGGSAIDVAKAIAGLALEENFASAAEFLEGEGSKRLNSYGLPFVAIPTTAGTGAEVARNAVIINRPTRSKRSFRSNYLFARIAIIDPTLTVNLPQEITASSGVDALTHLIEGYVCRKANLLTDVLAIRGISLVGEARGFTHKFRFGYCSWSIPIPGGITRNSSWCGKRHTSCAGNRI